MNCSVQRPCLALLLVALVCTATPPVWADIFGGIAAFERGDFSAALRELEPLAEAGTAEAQYYVGRMYHQGHVGEDPEQAARWYRLAAEQGHAGAQNNLGVLYEQGLGLSQSSEEAARWYRRAAEQSMIVAQVNLATLYEEGRGVEADMVEAARWYRRAADAGHVRAQHRLGVLYDEGRLGAPDPAKAARWYRSAAKQGYAPSQLALAQLYEEGRGVARSTKHANKWRRLAAAQGLAPDLVPDAGAAAAATGLVDLPAPIPAEPAPNAAGVEVVLTPPDPDSVLPPQLSALRQRALAGEAEASYALGRKYAAGEGVPESRVEAGRWYLSAAEQGHPTAAYLLGFQYLRGHGVATRRDLARAHCWFAVAASGGIADGTVWRDRVAKKMTHKELEQARSLFDEWQAAR